MPKSSTEIVTSIRLSHDEHEALKALAASQHRSLSGQLRALIEQAVAADPDSKAAAA